ncbi:MAG TPA: KTSC domain-containing protein [Candidatus Paceibacterota bacterium]|nr:KTSC domain-containing protein [Candidatus Paceibacterota bacterium]
MIMSGGVKMTAVDADAFESVGYAIAGKKLYVKFRNAATQCYEGVPSFRYQGLLAAPRKDAYFRTYIQNHFLVKEAAPAQF